MADNYRTATEKAVAQLRAYGQYITDNAENIVGNIDSPNYVTEGGIRISFTLVENDCIPTLEVVKEYIVLDAAYEGEAMTSELNQRTCECGWHGFVDGWGYDPPSYCPNCGARVVG